jgi:hypothetical protein
MAHPDDACPDATVVYDSEGKIVRIKMKEGSERWDFIIDPPADSIAEALHLQEHTPGDG